MYNHYIPQSDGSFRRSAVQDAQRKPQRPSPPPPTPKPPEEPERCPEPAKTPYVQDQCKWESGSKDPLGFIKKLLPKELDIWDLIIIAFLILLSSDESEDSLSPLLTVALYFLL